MRSLAASLAVPAPIELDTMARSRPIASSSALRRAASPCCRSTSACALRLSVSSRLFLKICSAAAISPISSLRSAPKMGCRVSPPAKANMLVLILSIGRVNPVRTTITPKIVAMTGRLPSNSTIVITRLRRCSASATFSMACRSYRPESPLKTSLSALRLLRLASLSPTTRAAAGDSSREIRTISVRNAMNWSTWRRAAETASASTESASSDSLCAKTPSDFSATSMLSPNGLALSLSGDM